jgi:DNA polymerase epsilon subunit 2
MAAVNRLFKNANEAVIPSSSPAFGTPVLPIIPSRDGAIPAPAALKRTILPIILPPATLRPVAVRIFTRNHNLNLKSNALAALATFIGRHCGAGWREEGLAEKVLEEVAKTWKRLSGPVIVDGDGEMLKNILKSLEASMVGGRIVPSKAGTPSLSRQGSSFTFGSGGNILDAAQIRPGLPDSHSSFGISNLEVTDPDEEEDASKDPREWIKVINAFDQPRLMYNVAKKHFEL